MAIDKSHFTVPTLQKLKTILKTFKGYEKDYSDRFIFIYESGNTLVQVIYKKEEYNWSFAVMMPSSERDTDVITQAFYGRRTPASATTLTGGNDFGTNDTALFDYFNGWVALVIQHESFSFDDGDEFIKQYEEELFSDFEFMDEDGDEKAYDDKQQDLLYKYLDYYEAKLLDDPKSETEEIKGIISDVHDLKETIQSKSKKVIKKHLVKIWAATKRHSTKTYRDVVDVAKKEFIKVLLKGGVHQLPKLLEDAQHWIHSLHH